MVVSGKLIDSGRGYKTFQPNSLQQIEKELDIFCVNCGFIRVCYDKATSGFCFGTDGNEPNCGKNQQ